MKRIVIDARELRQSTGRYIERLIHYLQQIDTENEYIILLRPEDMDGWKATNPNFHKLASPYPEFTFAEQLGFARQLYGLHADLVHFGMIQQPILYWKPSITTIHDMTTAHFRNPATNPIVFTIKQLVYRGVIWFAAHKSRKAITPTEYVRQDLAAYTHVNPAKIVATHEAVDDFDQPAVPLPFFEGKRFIMFNGRPLPHKNLHRLIEAFAMLHQKYPDLYLMIAGKKNKSLASYEKFIAKLGLSERVILTDWITDGQLKWAMQHAQTYVWASLSEGFGLPPLEAMCQGAPVASSNASCMPEVLGDAVHYFDPYDVQDMARAIGDLVGSEELRQTYIQKGKQQITKYSWRCMAEQTLEIYRKVLNV